MKKPKIKTLSKKIILMLLGVFLSVNVVATILGAIFGQLLKDSFANFDTNNITTIIFLGVAVILALCLAIFAVLIRRAIVRRLITLNSAVNQVVKGDYTVSVPVEGYDEIANLTENFNTMTAELKANEYLSKEFARNVSHEFKTPLSIIHGYAEILETRATDNDTKEKLNIIISEAMRLSSMSKSLLDLSALDGAIIKRDDTFNPLTQIETILQSAQLLITEKNITVDLKAENFTVTNNENLLYRVWQNLISNAIKFSNTNGTINIALTKSDGGFIFEIADNGIGINDEDKEKLFSLFFVGDKSRNTEGSGLGLPLARKIVERLGGKMSFESSRNTGTRFVVRL